MMKTKVLIPIYRAFTPEEESAFKHNCQMLKAHPIAIIAPEDLDTSFAERLCPEVETLRVSDEWLGRRNGIKGYNKMMLSEEFYALFEEWDYILICHTDAWIFRDELELWAGKGYDCVAAPWIRRKIYDMPLIKEYMALRCYFKHRRGERCRSDLYSKVGNGGLSLRNVSSFRKACVTYSKQIEEHLAIGGHFYNEDVFWASVPTEFRYPSQMEALDFAFDTNPAYCYRLKGERLPMGCHSWSKSKMWRFWRNFIHL